MRRSDFLACLLAAAVWAVVLTLFAMIRVGPDACLRNCLTAAEDSADLVTIGAEKGPTLLPTRWMRKRW